MPVFGLRISSAIMQCFDLPGLHDMARELRVAMLDENPVTYTRGGPGLHEDASISAKSMAGATALTGT